MLANMKLCANVPGQYAIQTALGGYQSINDLICEGGRLRRQRDIAYEMLSAIPGVSVVHPCASLYMFPRLDPDVYPIEDDREFFKELLEATNVVLVQGTGFNWPKPTPAWYSCLTNGSCATPSTALPSSSLIIVSAILERKPFRKTACSLKAKKKSPVKRPWRKPKIRHKV